MNNMLANHQTDKVLSTPIIGTPGPSLIFRFKGFVDYQTSWQAMQTFTNHRDFGTPDEIWLLSHPPVFTQGQNGKPEHILDAGDIPIVNTDRGGQVTYHGPGQLMVYTLIDLKRKKFNIRQFVSLLEQSIIDYLASHQILAHAKCDAPGVYVKSEQARDKKICSIGLRVRRGCTYHGIAFNVAMDLGPFSRINPCGFAELEMTQCSNLGGPEQVETAARDLCNYLMKNLRYTSATYFYDDQSESAWTTKKTI